MRASGVKLADQVVIDLHARGASGGRFARIHPENYRKRIFFLACGRQFHECADGVDEQDFRADAGEGDGRALMDFDPEAIGDEPHDAGRFHPGNFFQSLFPRGQWHEENVAANVAAHDLHNLQPGHVPQASNFDFIARIDAEAPGMFAVVIKRRDRCAAGEEEDQGDDHPSQAGGGFFRQGTAADGDALLSTQEGGFLFHVQVEHARVVEAIVRRGTRRFVDGWIKLFLRDGRTSFTRHPPGLSSGIAERK